MTFAVSHPSSKKLLGGWGTQFHALWVSEAGGGLIRQKHSVSHEKVAQLLRAQNYSLQSNRKTGEGADHPDRDAQFRYIGAQVKQALAAGAAAISVDTKKKELLGNYANGGKQRLPAKKPFKVNGHDFPSPEVPRAYPYGIYDLGCNAGFVNVGTDHDRGAFAVASIRGWWRGEGRWLYEQARGLLITADGGGGDGARLRLWKLQLQNLADETGLSISVCHFPAGTRSGTRSNIGCSLSSPRIGAANRFGIMRRS